MFREAFNSGFRGVIGRITGWVRDTLFTPCDDNGCRTRLAAETREEGRYTVDDAKQIGVHDLA